MDLEKLERIAKEILPTLQKLGERSPVPPFGNYLTLKSEVRNLMSVASRILPDHKEFFSDVMKKIGNFDFVDARQAVEHVLTIIEIEKTSESLIREMKVFESAEEKLKQAGISFRKDDYTSTFHNFNTALELVLKDKLAIPSTITGINTSNIMDVLTKHKVEPYLYLEEARKHVLLIDNKIKHQGYCPSKIDCINGIKATEELIAKLRNIDMKLTEEVKNKIYEGL